MITRGIIIGKIIDDLSRLQGQIDLRCQLGLTDLNKYCEDFAKEVLNICLGLNLRNLNSGRSNEPGLDLGDKVNKTAFQITSMASSAKVNSTLQKVSTDQLKTYSKIKIFILGKKQGSYDALDVSLLDKCSFETDDIWDISDLCRHTMSLKYEELFELYRLFETAFQVVLIELEMPDKEGKYPTTLSDKLEVIPNTFCLNAKKYLALHTFYSLKEVKKVFDAWAQLPRVTREFLKIIITIGQVYQRNYTVEYHELTRKLHIKKGQINEEITILAKRDLLHAPYEDDTSLRTNFEYVMGTIVEFCQDNDCLSKVLVALDFRLLDED